MTLSADVKQYTPLTFVHQKCQFTNTVVPVTTRDPPPPYSFLVYGEIGQKSTRNKVAEPCWLTISTLDER